MLSGVLAETPYAATLNDQTLLSGELAGTISCMKGGRSTLDILSLPSFLKLSRICPPCPEMPSDHAWCLSEAVMAA